MDELDLTDWRRRISELYASVRAPIDPHVAWQGWVAARDQMFRTHGQSPLPADRRRSYPGCTYFPYDPAARVLGHVSARELHRYEIETSGGSTMSFSCFADVHFDLGNCALSLQLYWLEDYAGGIYLPFADATSGDMTYGGGRYLFDTAKGVDLGMEDGRLVLDFNFAYNPSCSYDPRWVCPLTPPANRLGIPIEAGEMHSSTA